MAKKPTVGPKGFWGFVNGVIGMIAGGVDQFICLPAGNTLRLFLCSSSRDDYCQCSGSKPERLRLWVRYQLWISFLVSVTGNSSGREK